ncbi:MAG: hypothetical protein Q8P12_03750, partial [bacterium]|nr:hypothetical protein [bacterium]
MKDLRIFLVSFVFFLGTPVLLFMLFLVFSGFLPEVLVVDIFPFLLIIGVLYAIRFFFAVRQGKGPFLISLLALFVAVGGLVLFVLFQPIHITPPIPTRDARRVTDLR